jgi:hypothetical protein
MSPSCALTKCLLASLKAAHTVTRPAQPAEGQSATPRLSWLNSSTVALLACRDAHEACSVVPSAKGRRECYSVFGIDGEALSTAATARHALAHPLQPAFGQQLAAAAHNVPFGVDIGDKMDRYYGLVSRMENEVQDGEPPGARV